VIDIAIALGSTLGLAATGFLVCGLGLLLARLADYRDPQERREARRLNRSTRR